MDLYSLHYDGSHPWAQELEVLEVTSFLLGMTRDYQKDPNPDKKRDWNFGFRVQEVRIHETLRRFLFLRRTLAWWIPTSLTPVIFLTRVRGWQLMIIPFYYVKGAEEKIQNWGAIVDTLRTATENARKVIGGYSFFSVVDWQLTGRIIKKLVRPYASKKSSVRRTIQSEISQLLSRYIYQISFWHRAIVQIRMNPAICLW